jgi:hypothetical protein
VKAGQGTFRELSWTPASVFLIDMGILVDSAQQCCTSYSTFEEQPAVHLRVREWTSLQTLNP